MGFLKNLVIVKRVKRQWEELFETSVIDRGFISPLCKELYVSIKKLEEMGTRLEQALHPEDTHFTSRHRKKYLISLVITEMKTETMMKRHDCPPEH